MSQLLESLKLVFAHEIDLGLDDLVFAAQVASQYLLCCRQCV